MNGNSIEFSIEKLSALDENIIDNLGQNLNTDFIKIVKNIGLFNDRFTIWQYYWHKKNSQAFIRNDQLDGATD